MPIRFLKIIFITFIFTSDSLAADRLAIIELSGENRALASMITEDIQAAAEEAAKSNGFEVASLDSIRKVLGEDGRLKGCSQHKCIEKAAKAVKANLVLVGQIDAHSFGYSLTMKIKDWPNLKTIKGDKVDHNKKMGLIKAARSTSKRLFSRLGPQKSIGQSRLSGFETPVRNRTIAIAKSKAKKVKASTDCNKTTTMKVNIKTKSSRPKKADIFVDGQFKGRGKGPFEVSICAKLVEAETRYGIYAGKLKGLLLPGIEATVILKRFHKGKRGSRFSRININTADRNRLKQLPGIGDHEAKSIISKRKKLGRFNHCRDLIGAIGISGDIFERIAPVCIAK